MREVRPRRGHGPPRKGAPDRPPSSVGPRAAGPSKWQEGGSPLLPGALGSRGRIPGEGTPSVPHSPHGPRIAGIPVPSRLPGEAIGATATGLSPWWRAVVGVPPVVVPTIPWAPRGLGSWSLASSVWLLIRGGVSPPAWGAVILRPAGRP